MLTMQDCIELSQLTEEEIGAIADHEHVPDIIALEIGAQLMTMAGGEKRIATFIREDIEIARGTGHIVRAIELRAILKRYLAMHPNAV